MKFCFITCLFHFPFTFEIGKKIFIGCENKAISRGFFSDGEPESAGHLLYFTSMGEVARSPTPTWDSDPIFILEVSPYGSEFQEESFRGRQQLRAVQMCSPCVWLCLNNAASEQERFGCASSASPQERSLGCWKTEVFGAGFPLDHECLNFFSWVWVSSAGEESRCFSGT